MANRIFSHQSKGDNSNTSKNSYKINYLKLETNYKSAYASRYLHDIELDDIRGTNPEANAWQCKPTISYQVRQQFTDSTYMKDGTIS